MTSVTPNIGLVLYNDTTDSSANFLAWRTALDGTASSSNFYLIDTAFGLDRARLTSLEALKVIIPVIATFSSGSLYTATGITAISSYVNDTVIMLSLDINNTGTTTLNINSLGVRTLVKVNTSGTQVNLDANDLVANRYYFFRYNLSTTSWVWIAATSADQINITGTTGNLVTVSSGTLLGTLTQSLMISQTVHAATTKSTPIDTDELGLIDSAASNVLKRLTWANLKTALSGSWGTQINGLTSKATPVNADEFVIADSAASYASKKSTLAQIVAVLKTLIATDTLAAPTNISTNNVTSSAHGFAPVSPADATKFLNGAVTPAYAAVKDSDLSTSDITTNDVSTSKHGFTPKQLFSSQKYLSPWITVQKTADETISSSAVLQNDDALTFTLAASTKYTIRGKIFFDTGATEDFKFRFNNSGGTSTVVRSVISWIVPGTTTIVPSVETSFPTTTNAITGTGTTNGFIDFIFVVQNNTSGTFVFQWAQNTSGGTNTTVLAGSYLEYQVT